MNIFRYNIIIILYVYDDILSTVFGHNLIIIDGVPLDYLLILTAMKYHENSITPLFYIDIVKHHGSLQTRKVFFVQN